MLEGLKKFASEFFVTGDPIIYGAMVAIGITMITIVAVLTYFKKWGWLWRNWITTVDHKKIGIMYIIASIIMLFRGGVDALMMRLQLAIPNSEFLNPEHYNQVFTTHGTIMILFMAMPFMFGLFNVIVPLQIGARDVAFPFLNALSFLAVFLGCNVVQPFLRYRWFTGCGMAELSATVGTVAQSGGRTELLYMGYPDIRYRFPGYGYQLHGHDH